jgi:nicotinate-nucleotide adenylyltransferase
MVQGPIGILGGIFDPIHNGHLSIATCARDFFKLDQVVFIPSGNPPHKSSTVAAGPNDRLAMLKLAIQNEPSFTLWGGDINRPGYSFTIESLRTLRETYRKNPFYFIIGSDNVSEIMMWKEYREILSMVVLCVVSRPGFPLDIPESLLTVTIKEFPSPQCGLSSTMLRDYLRKGYSCRYLVPDPVLEYIKIQRLYS